MKTIGAFFAWPIAFEACIALRAYSDDVSYFYIANSFGANASGYADDFVPNNDGVCSGSLHNQYGGLR